MKGDNLEKVMRDKCHVMEGTVFELKKRFELQLQKNKEENNNKELIGRKTRKKQNNEVEHQAIYENTIVDHKQKLVKIVDTVDARVHTNDTIEDNPHIKLKNSVSTKKKPLPTPRVKYSLEEKEKELSVIYENISGNIDVENETFFEAEKCGKLNEFRKKLVNMLDKECQNMVEDGYIEEDEEDEDSDRLSQKHNLYINFVENIPLNKNINISILREEADINKGCSKQQEIVNDKIKHMDDLEDYISEHIYANYNILKYAYTDDKALLRIGSEDESISRNISEDDAQISIEDKDNYVVDSKTSNVSQNKDNKGCSKQQKIVNDITKNLDDLDDYVCMTKYEPVYANYNTLKYAYPDDEASLRIGSEYESISRNISEDELQISIEDKDNYDVDSKTSNVSQNKDNKEFESGPDIDFAEKERFLVNSEDCKKIYRKIYSKKYDENQKLQSLNINLDNEECNILTVPKHRLAEIIQDIKHTEKLFIKKLEQVIPDYKHGIKNHSSFFTTSRTAKLISTTIDDLFMMQEEFFKSLEKSDNSIVSLFEVFIDYEQLFVNYQKYFYINSKNPIVKTTNERESLQEEMCLSSFLNQRLTRYKMFWEQILKELRGFYFILPVAEYILDLISDVLDTCNKILILATVENNPLYTNKNGVLFDYRKVLPTAFVATHPPDLSGYGNYLFRDSFKSSIEKTSFMVFLFEKVILLTKENGPNNFVYRDFIHMSEIGLLPQKKKKILRMQLFQRSKTYHRDVVIELEARTEEIRGKWWEAINACLWAQMFLSRELALKKPLKT